MRLRKLIPIILLFSLAAAVAPGDYPPDPTAMSDAMHELSIIIFRQTSRKVSAEQTKKLSREANEAFWREVLYARESGYGYD